MKLVWPAREYLASYVDALERGWSPDNIRGRITAEEELNRIANDADAFLASLVDREGAGPPLTMLDGTKAPRIPGYRKWMWDGEFCGSIGFRWQPGTEDLPPYCLGHTGYAVVPWKKGRGYATAALAQIITDAAAHGLRFIIVTTAPDNVASQRVIEKNGGVFVDEFTTPPGLGSMLERRYRIPIERVQRHAAQP
jgi:predicted acetyltransferase